MDRIIIKGARQHNLKEIDLELPRDKLIVITGVSGSGKSSLAFDTIYAEGQRRYVESLSAYARQFLAQMDKPEVDSIEGLSPAISIDQKRRSHNPRSTVGTVTEIYDYLRLLFARIGKPHCYICGRPIAQQSSQQIIDRVMELPEETRVQVLAPVVRGRKGEYRSLFGELRREGYTRVRVDHELHQLDEEITLDRYKKHDIEALVDRVVVRPKLQGRIADSVETALKLAEGNVIISIVDGEELFLSEQLACPHCGVSYGKIEPRMFSFNSPYGACPECGGLGVKLEIDPGLVIDKRKTLLDGGIIPWARSNSRWLQAMLAGLCREYRIGPDVPLGELPEEKLKILLYGTDGGKVRFPYTNRAGRTRTFEAVFRGVIPSLEHQLHERQGEYPKKQYGHKWAYEELKQYMSTRPCPKCGGKRLRPEGLAFTAGGKDIIEVTELSVKEAYRFFNKLKTTEREELIAHQILKEIRSRLKFMIDVGLDYLTLNRPAGTLAGGEAQRIRLATQIGSQLVGVLYILDEPSVGLHQRDIRRLLDTLKGMRDLGNTVIVVEHDEATIRAADFIVDIGPGAGAHGGEIVAAGPLAEILKCKRSLTGQYLSGKQEISVPKERRRPQGRWIEVKGAREHNLKNIDVKFPLGLFICVTGVSGSGKSTLVEEILYRGAAHRLHLKSERPGEHDEILGLEQMDKVIDIDQSPIGRTPRSNPATYTGVFDYIRKVFAQVPESRMRGYKPGRFSFNVKGGRCEACRGEGLIKIEMHFLPDVYVPCEVCQGRRYNRETLQIKYKNRSIANVLEMTVEQALKFFENIPPIRRKLQTIYDVGLGYIRLGQPAPQLSGGEAQRVKLAEELSKRSTGRTLYILDEPTTGLHMDDIKKLLNVLHRLVELGNTVVVIEHNPDVIKTADWLIDLGPEGGDEGGWIIAEGPPEAVAGVERSYTGGFLRKVLESQASVCVETS